MSLETLEDFNNLVSDCVEDWITNCKDDGISSNPDEDTYTYTGIPISTAYTEHLEQFSVSNSLNSIDLTVIVNIMKDLDTKNEYLNDSGAYIDLKDGFDQVIRSMFLAAFHGSVIRKLKERMVNEK